MILLAEAAASSAVWDHLGGIVTTIVAVLGVFISLMTVLLTIVQNKASRKATEQQMQQNREQAEQQAAAAKQQFESARQEAQSNRFTRAIEHLKDESLAIRMGALVELRMLGQESSGYQSDIVRILAPFIRHGIETPELLLPPKTEEGLPRPDEDIFIACEIISEFHESRKLDLQNLQAEKLDLSQFHLQGVESI